MNNLKVSDQYVIRKVSGETIAVPLVRNTNHESSLYVLNQTAAIILQSIQDGDQVGKLGSRLEKSFEELPLEEELQGDIDQCILDLKEIGIIIQ